MLVGAAFVVLIVTLVQVRDQQRKRAHTEQVIATATDLERRVLDLETDARRFAVTGRGVYLRPLVDASAQMKAGSQQLVELSQGDATRVLRAQQLQDGVRHYAATWAALVIEVAARNPKKAQTLVLSAAGEREQDTLREKFTQFTAAEQARSDRARAQADRSEGYAIALGGIGLGGSLALIALYAIYVSQRIVQPVRRVAAATQRFAAGELDERVPENRDDEVGELKRNFNTMASAIQTKQLELESQTHDLERLASLLRSVLDSTIDGIVLTDLEGNIQLANRPLRRLAVELGFRGGANVIDQLLSVADKVSDRDRYVETMERLRARPEQPSADEFELLGGLRTFIGYTAPVRGEQGLIGRIWTLREVTQERELDRLKDEFVATVSHELRTPLTSLMGFLEMLREGEAGELTAEQERLFQRFFRSSTATDQAIPGTGLGLAITRAIAEAHDGRITFRSEPGEGTCFRIELPL